MTTFEGYVSNPDDLAERVEANALTFDVTEGVDADQETPVALVRVEASYKPGGSCEHPVNLTILDAIKAAALVTLAHDSLSETACGMLAAEETRDTAELLAQLRELINVDGSVWELRTWLHSEIEHRLKPVDDEGQADAAGSEAGQ